MTDQLDTAAIRAQFGSLLDEETPEDIRNLAKVLFDLHVQLDTDAQVIENLRAENERLRYVLDGVAGAIDTGRNEPLQIWRDQINIARTTLAQARNV